MNIITSIKERTPKLQKNIKYSFFLIKKCFIISNMSDFENSYISYNKTFINAITKAASEKLTSEYFKEFNIVILVLFF